MHLLILMFYVNKLFYISWSLSDFTEIALYKTKLRTGRVLLLE